MPIIRIDTDAGNVQREMRKAHRALAVLEQKRELNRLQNAQERGSEETRIQARIAELELELGGV